MPARIASLFLRSAGHFLSGVILFDSIVDGLAISLMAGEVAALLIRLMAVGALLHHTREPMT